MRFLFFIGVLFLIYSCSENKGQTITVNPYIEPIIPDSLIDLDTAPIYRKAVDRNLTSGFEFPIRIKSGNNFKYEFKNDSIFDDAISTCIEYNSRFLKPVEIVAPAKSLILTHEAEGSRKSYTFKCHFFENGKVVNLIIEISGIDSVILHPEDRIDSQDYVNYGVIGYLIPDQKNTKKELTISISIDESEPPFYFTSVKEFFKEYKKCIVPAELEKLVFAHKSKYRMYYFEKGILKNTDTIGLSQSPKGHKQKQGDNKLPEGMYRITEKSRGPFYGETGPWLGVAWMQFSYPNQYDAINGFNNGTISLAEKNAIVTADKNLKPTNSYTELGGRIGIHGWNGDWIPNGTQNLTWGCITMFNRDIDVLYDKLPMNTYIIIVP